MAQDPLWQARHATPERVGTSAQNAALLGYRKDTLAVLAAMLAVVTLARMLRGYREKRVGTIGLTYPDRIIRMPQGLSLLEASLRNGVPHAHVCRGRGRCSMGSGAERQVVDKRPSVLPIAMAGLNLNKNELRRIFLRGGNRPAFG